LYAFDGVQIKGEIVGCWQEIKAASNDAHSVNRVLENLIGHIPH